MKEEMGKGVSIPQGAAHVAMFHVCMARVGIEPRIDHTGIDGRAGGSDKGPPNPLVGYTMSWLAPSSHSPSGEVAPQKPLKDRQGGFNLLLHSIPKRCQCGIQGALQLFPRPLHKDGVSEGANSIASMRRGPNG